MSQIACVMSSLYFFGTGVTAETCRDSRLRSLRQRGAARHALCYTAEKKAKLPRSPGAMVLATEGFNPRLRLDLSSGQGSLRSLRAKAEKLQWK